MSPCYPPRQLVIITRDRWAEVTARIAEHAAHFEDPSFEVVICDDGRGAAPRASLDHAASLMKAFGRRLSYVGRAERQAFVDRVRSRVAAATGSLAWALGLSSGDDARVTPGANRNAALLHVMQSGPALMIDDDIRLTISLPHEATDVGAGGARAIPDAARDQVAHLLGFSADPAHYLAPSDAKLQTILEDMTSVLADDERGPRLASFGHWGDMALDRPWLWLLRSGIPDAHLNGARHDHPLRALSEGLLGVKVPALLSPSGLMTGSLVLGGDTRLPPFCPEGRGEDGLYGALLARLHPEARLLQMPHAFHHHRPTGRARAFSPGEVGDPRMADLTRAVMSSLPTPPGAPETREAVGRSLRTLAEAPAWEDTCREAWREQLGVVHRALVERLRRHRHQPAIWANDVCDAIEAIELAQNGPLTIREGGRAVPKETFRVVLRSFGELLETWSGVLDAVRSSVDVPIARRIA